MSPISKARGLLWRFFHPEGKDGSQARGFISLPMGAMVTAELLIFIYLQRSSNAGELPHYITDVMIVAVSAVEVILAPFLSHAGAQKRRTIMWSWIFSTAITLFAMFFLPAPETTPDDGFCGVNPTTPDGIPTMAAIRLGILVVAGLVNGLGKSAMLGQGLAYLEAHGPSVNLFMHVGILMLSRVMIYVMGKVVVGSANNIPWLQILFVFVQLLAGLIGLYRYPNAAPNSDKDQLANGALCGSIRRVLSSWVVLLQILAMGLMTAALWGYGFHRASYVQIRYNIKLYDSPSVLLAHMVKNSPIILGTLLIGYMYTRPIMPKFDKAAAATNAARNVFRLVLLFSLLTAMWGCDHNSVAGSGETYVQPACASNCGCDWPWMEFTPVCEPTSMQTYFSPCHAGCTSEETVNKVGMYSNCTCAPGGRVIIGACDDGSCELYFFLHQMMYVLMIALGTLSLAWQITIVLETVEKRDTGAAVGVMSSAVALFTFVAGHIGYQAMSSSTCILSNDYKCLLHHESFASLVGYTSAGLAGISFFIGIVIVIILKRQAKNDDNVAL